MMIPYLKPPNMVEPPETPYNQFFWLRCYLQPQHNVRSASTSVISQLVSAGFEYTQFFVSKKVVQAVVLNLQNLGNTNLTCQVKLCGYMAVHKCGTVQYGYIEIYNHMLQSCYKGGMLVYFIAILCNKWQIYRFQAENLMWHLKVLGLLYV